MTRIDPRSLARSVLKRMSDGTYAADMDQMREDAEELAAAVLAAARRKTARKKR